MTTTASLQRPCSNDSVLLEAADQSTELTEMQKRLFQQKYKALKVQKEKKKIDRSVRNFQQLRDQHFQLPDDVRYALKVACGCDPKPKQTPLPEIVNDGALLLAPDSQADGAVGACIESDRAEGRTTRREKVRIVETQRSDQTAERSKKPFNRVVSSEESKPQTERVGEEISNAIANSETPEVVRRSGSRNGPNNSASGHNRVRSGKSEASQTRHECGITYGSWSRPASTSTTSSNRGSQNSKRKQSECKGAPLQRRKSRVRSGSAKLKETNNTRDPESEDSDYFDSDLDLDQVHVPCDIVDEVSLYRRACRRHGVVTSRHVEDGLKKGSVEATFSQLTSEELKAICVAVVESVSITRFDLSGNELSEQGLSYICEVFEENTFIKHLDLSDCRADRKGVGNLIQCLQMKNTVACLDLSGIGLCIPQVRFLSEYIENSSALQRLCLSYCEIDETGATILADALGSAICLSHMDLSWNQLRHKGALNFCLALKDNQTLNSLDLSWNGLGREGCAGLEVALAASDTLQHLDISSNRIGVLGLDCLLRGLAANSTLISIKMGNNPLPTDSPTAIINTLLSAQNSALNFLDLSYIAVEDEFLSKLTELRQSRVIYAYYGHVMSRKKDINGAMGSRSLTSFDPILVLFEYMKLQNMRLIDLFRSIDTNADKVISREELRAVFLSLNMGLPTGTFNTMFSKIDRDHSNTIDMDELKLVHRRVMRQARALKARVASSEEDEYGDVMHEFQDLVRKAVANRRSRRSSREGRDRPHSSNPLSGIVEHLTSLRSERSELYVKSPSRRNSDMRRLSPTMLGKEHQSQPGSNDVSRRGSWLSVSSAESGHLQ